MSIRLSGCKRQSESGLWQEPYSVCSHIDGISAETCPRSELDEFLPAFENIKAIVGIEVINFEKKGIKFKLNEADKAKYYRRSKLNDFI